MDSFKFSISENELVALPSGALWWPSQSLLCVSDLHFGKSNRLARKGQSWIPPYENQDTLLRLEKDLKTTKARMIICLGDSFDDNEGIGSFQKMKSFGFERCKRVKNGYGFLGTMTHHLKH